MSILIIKCNNRGKWYSDLVGKEVPLLAVEENEYMGDWIERNLKTESYPVIYFTKRPEEGFYILPSSDLDKLGSNRIFNTIEEALEILLTYYYEI